ncbi:MAG: bifunctional proline dehydrogenase/L-glutamate gamma-semialdehyde dehydrogenase PutA [Pseudomonadota bacterium]
MSASNAKLISKPRPFEALQDDLPPSPRALRQEINNAYRRDEQRSVHWLRAQMATQNAAHDACNGVVGLASHVQEASHVPAAPQIEALARKLVTAVRTQRRRASGVDALMQEFSLSSEEGVALMCMAEALLRIPDSATADRLIADKLGKGDWRSHLGESPSLFVNAATWGLLITGKLVATRSEHGLANSLTRLIAKGGEPLVRKGVDLAMRMLGNQFVAGQTIESALANSRSGIDRGYQYSYDMLGEAAVTAADARRYYDAYEAAIHAIGSAAAGRGIKDGPGISVKLSALHPRYSRAQRTRVMDELLPRLKNLVLLAARYAIGINIDAEETDRLDLSLDLLEALAHDSDLAGFDGIGFVVQAYQKRCPYVLDFLVDLAQRSGRKFSVRLVKGAYWDTEIKRAQVDGMTDYPVYTRKVHTDMSYLVCARKLLAHADVLYPQFATHNAQTLAAVQIWAAQQGVVEYEFQCLYGMGETLYDQVVGTSGLGVRCRIYAPVGPHRTLLAYLVRRLLENGANSSFVNRLVDPEVSIDDLIVDPFAAVVSGDGSAHTQIIAPAALYGQTRVNSAGLDFSDEAVLRQLSAGLAQYNDTDWSAVPLVAGREGSGGGGARRILNPANHDDVVGHVRYADVADIEAALAAAPVAGETWRAWPAAERAAILRRAADLLEAERTVLLALLVREAGKSLPNASGEIREAVDFLRFYATQIETMAPADSLGVVVCISPWNFPLAIFIGQISAALATGNAVLAKPAEQTPLVAYHAVRLLHEAGVPAETLQFLPGSGPTVGAPLVADSRVQAAVFTGSTGVAQTLNRVLAQRGATEGRELPLIAETGGQNAMIVDSSALPEQVVHDVLISAFDSAGQRCSALRVLCLQEEIADEILHMLRGAMQELSIGNTDSLAVDIGPVIDTAAQTRLLSHIGRMRGVGANIYEMPVTPAQQAQLAQGTFVLPTIIDITSWSMLTEEVFGPVLHVIRYRRKDLEALVDSINASGYGLTLGVHSRIDETIDLIASKAKVGNIYINRSMVGAVVESQPFGGEGLSGTGPKAGGPLYLQRLQQRRATTKNTSGASNTALPIDIQSKHGFIPAQVVHTSALPTFPSSPLARSWNDWLQVSRGDLAQHRSIELPGPTGEHNVLSFAPRGTVLCMPVSSASLLQQLDAIFCTGNQALLTEQDTHYLPPDLPAQIRQAILIVPERQLDDIRIAAVLVEKTRVFAWRVAMANRDGMLVAVLETQVDRAVDLTRLVVERALSVNTTAAGGNAKLMTLAN